jgi:glycosyltransferase involved in cell wall biosynthesis
VAADTRSSDTLTFLATYNERANIDHMLDAILALPERCDVLVVDDSSSDGTGARLEERATAEPRLHVVSRRGLLGIGSAHRLGWLYARHHGYARIVTLDADLSHDPLDIPRLTAALDSGADVALASRFAPGAVLGYTGYRRFVSRTGNGLARALLRLPIREFTTSFRAARLDRVPPGLVETVPQNGYGFFVTVVVRMARQGLRLTEIPIHFHDRKAGTSKLPKTEIVRSAINLACLTLDPRPFDPKSSDPQQGAAGSDACAHCGSPYVVGMPDGDRICLRCMHTA